VLFLFPITFILLYFISQIPITVQQVALYIFFIINSLIIATALHIFVLAVGILFTEVDNAIIVYRSFTRLAVAPIDVYKEPIRFIFTFILPIGIMMTVPVKGLFGLLTVPLALISLIIGLLSLF